MDCDDDAPAPGGRLPQRGYVRFSASVAREVCRRIVEGETQAEVCADPAMPSLASLRRWAQRRPAFGRILARARALGGRPDRRASTYCPVVAHEITARVSEGETLTSIAADPAMPTMSAIYYWRRTRPEFDEAMILAREALAERMSDLGWKMAQAATPETAYLTHVRLTQLRWTAAVMGPRTHGRLKSTAPPEPREVTTVLFRHFQIEEHPQTGLHRVVAYTPDPETMLPVRTSEGEWKTPVDPVAKMADIEELARKRLETWADRDEDDPEGWR